VLGHLEVRLHVFKLLGVMRNTRQGSLGSEGSDNPTIQQLMETVSSLQETVSSLQETVSSLQETVSYLQEAVAASRVDQERLMAEVRDEQVLRQDQSMAELDAS